MLFFFPILLISIVVYVILLIKVSIFKPSPFIAFIVSIFIIYLFLIYLFFSVISIYHSVTYQLFVFVRLLVLILVFSLFAQEFYAFFNPLPRHFQKSRFTIYFWLLCLVKLSSHFYQILEPHDSKACILT